jgi:hypothetical protein
MKSFLIPLAIIFAVLQCNSFSFAQELEEINAIRQKYADANAIVLKRVSDYSIFIENNVVKGICKSSEQVVINKEKGIHFQNRSISSSSFVELSDIKAFIQIHNGKKYVKKEVTEIVKKDDTDEGVFYDDQKTFSFTYPSAQQGAILNSSYTYTYNDPHFLGAYFWSNRIPCVDDLLIIRVKKNIKLDYKLFHTENIGLNFTKVEVKDEIIYTWRLANNVPGPDYGDAPNFKYYEPQLIFYITNYEVNGETKTLLGTPKDLYKWYTSLIKNVNKTEDKSLKKIADSLVVGVTDEWEKVKKIFYWVQDNVSYLAFEDGLGGFVPRDAAVVCNRKYGDCKDMASIINEMLRMVNIKSYLTWIGSRDIPYTYEQVPTPVVDNHMIASYLNKKNEWVFLDATGKKSDIDLYTSFIQGKQAMIGISADSFLLVTVPIKDTAVSVTNDAIEIAIKDKTVVGKGTASLSGYDGLRYFYRNENFNKEEQLDYFKAYFAKGSNKINFKNILFSMPLRQAISIQYEFELPDYAKLHENEMYINLNMDKGLIPEKILEDRKIPVAMNHCTQKKLTVTFQIPEGYKVEFIPTDSKAGNSIVGFSSIYKQNNNQIIYTYSFYLNTLLVNASQFKEFNKVVSEQIRAQNQTISLVKK